MHRNSQFFILVEVIQMLMDFKDCSWVSMRRKCNTHSTVCADRPQRLRTPFNEDTINEAMERELWRISRDIGRKCGVSQQNILEVLLDWINVTSCETHFHFQTSVHVLYMHLRSAIVSITHLTPFDGDVYLEI
jgi:hypothetical protein